MRDSEFDVFIENVEKFIKENAAKNIKVGDRVKITGNPHSPETKDKEGVVKIVSTPALGILFDGMEEVHKWYVAGELKVVIDEDSNKSKKDKKMKMDM